MLRQNLSVLAIANDLHLAVNHFAHSKQGRQRSQVGVIIGSRSSNRQNKYCCRLWAILKIAKLRNGIVKQSRINRHLHIVHVSLGPQFYTPSPRQRLLYQPSQFPLFPIPLSTAHESFSAEITLSAHQCRQTAPQSPLCTSANAANRRSRL